MKTDFNDGRKPLRPAVDLIKEANKIYEMRSMIFGENRKIIHSGQEEEFLKSAAKEINLRNHVIEQQAAEIGRVLSEVKMVLPHGYYLQWILDNCPFDDKTALHYVYLYNVTLAHPALMRMKKSVLYHIGSPNFPEKLREILAESIVGVYDYSMKDIIALQTKFINNELTEDSEELKSFLKNQRQVNILERWKLEWKGSIAALEKQKAKYQRLLTRQKEVAGEQMTNEYTEYWKSSVTILSDAINQFSGLYGGWNAAPTSFPTEELGHEIEEYAEQEDCSIGNEIYPPQRPVQRGIPMFGLSAKELSRLDNDDIYQLKYYEKVLGPEDLVPIYNNDISEDDLDVLYREE